MIEEIMKCLWVFLGTISFGIIFNIRGKNLMFASLGGLFSWIVCQTAKGYQIEEVQSYFLAAVVIAFYSECMAIYRKAPVTVFIVLGMIPLVPGGSIFYTMHALIMGNYSEFVHTGVTTFSIAGVIALGILIASFCVQIVRYLCRSFKNWKQKIMERNNT